MTLFYTRMLLFWGVLFLFASTCGLYLYLPDLIQRSHDSWGYFPWSRHRPNTSPSDAVGPDEVSMDPSPILQSTTIAAVSAPVSLPAATSTPASNLTTVYDDPRFTGVRTLVIPKLSTEDTSWVDANLGDLISKGLLVPKLYVVDDPTAPLHPPVNKGREGMIYLTYIIDHYDALSDISIFMHAHRHTWHNHELLDTDAVLMLRALSGERILRDGYMNLRCKWGEQCPDVVRPLSAWSTPHAWVRNIFPTAWTELFPGEPLPEVIAQPCCSQFAVSREAIRRVPKERYLAVRQWLMDTELHDNWSGRIMEFVWQYLFTGKGVYCPSEDSCNCEGYGICFGSQEKLEHFRKLQLAHTALSWKLDDLTNKTDEEGNASVDDTPSLKDTTDAASDARDRMDELAKTIEHLKLEAVQNGKQRGDIKPP